jgi:hypothetical protein
LALNAKKKKIRVTYKEYNKKKGCHLDLLSAVKLNSFLKEAVEVIDDYHKKI